MSDTSNAPTTAIAKTDQPNGETGLAVRRSGFNLQPANLAEAMEFSRLISASELCPKEYHGKPANVLIAVQMGAELGIPPMQALQNIAVINGRPSMWGDLVIGLVQASGLLESIEERDAQEALAQGEGKCTVKRKGMSGEATTRTYSLEMADSAGLRTRGGSSSPWQTHPGRMLQMRARSWALRDLFADVLKGLQMREEVEDYPTGPVIEMPRRSSAAAGVSTADVDRFLGAGKGAPATASAPGSTSRQAPAQPHNTATPAGRLRWDGSIASVASKTGTTNGKPWTLYTVTGADGTSFSTFDSKDADFAKQAGASPVAIVYEITAKGTKKIVSILPAETREPGDEEPGA